MDDPTPEEFAAAKRRRDGVTGIIQPWFTHPALDVVERWDLRGKSVLEWGGGFSTLWWADRVGPSGRVHTVEHAMYATDPHGAWYERLVDAAAPLPHVSVVRVDDGYALPPAGRWDVVVVDGEPTHLRTKCIESALTLPRPLILICDNWQQDYVYVDEESDAMMRPYAGEFYVQQDHIDHAGRPWQTAIWRLP